MSVILLTGGTGFLGSHLARRLAGHHDLLILKRSTSDLSRLAGLEDKVRFYDLDRQSVVQPLVENQVEVIIHAAANYGRAGQKASQVLTDNLLFPVRLLEGAVTAGVRAFINTDTVLPLLLNPYALSKGQFVEWLNLYSSHVKVVNLAVQFFYGPGDSDHSFVCQTLRGLLEDRPELDFTPGEQRRDFLYIDDLVEAYLAVLAALPVLGATGLEEFSVGSGQASTVREFVELAHRLAGSGSRLNFGAYDYRANEPMLTCADPSRLRGLGWEVRVPLAEGLERTIAHLRAQGSGS